MYQHLPTLFPCRKISTYFLQVPLNCEKSFIVFSSQKNRCLLFFSFSFFPLETVTPILYFLSCKTRGDQSLPFNRSAAFLVRIERSSQRSCGFVHHAFLESILSDFEDFLSLGFFWKHSFFKQVNTKRKVLGFFNSLFNFLPLEISKGWTESLRHWSMQGTVCVPAHTLASVMPQVSTILCPCTTVRWEDCLLLPP